ncbi:glycerol kinase GlpK [Chitinolyticbacter albus]|uniref:glycerol kinase GlpK n=1 Tax=Chitinolyticbacter albus TaxID=2961951 RepID=UPI00210ECE7A|nr:glycerol kinase GlpK [Chitinolyticbacter albus]
MPAAPYLLAIDQGTTSTRCIVFDAGGLPVAQAQREFAQHFRQPGWVEHDAHEIFTSVLVTMTEAVNRAGIDAADIAGIGIANQRETTVIWERASGRAIHPAIVWQSRQSQAICDAFKADGAEPLVRERTGLLLDPYFSASKIRWLLDNVQGARVRAIRGELAFGTIDSWLIWQLSGGAVHVTDETNAARTLLYDIHRRCWDDELLRLFDIPAALLPRVQPSSADHASTLPQFGFGLRLPIRGAAGDQQAALVGQGCFAPGMAKNTYGTGCFMLLHTGAVPVLSMHGLLTTAACSFDGSPQYALEGSIFVAGSVIQWLRDGLGLLDTAADSLALAASVPDNGGVYVVPAFVGLGAPYWRSDARGAVFGLTRGSGKAHLTRAALEAIAYQTRDVLAAMQLDAGIALTELRADGGAIANDFLAQFQSDLLGVPLLRPRVTETTALGAAYLAGLAAGVWDAPSALAGQWQEERRFMPQMDEVRRETLYAGWQQAVQATLGFRPVA